MIAPSEGIEDFGNYNECDVDGMGAADIVGGNARLTFFVWVKTSGVYRRHISHHAGPTGSPRRLSNEAHPRDRQVAAGSLPFLIDTNSPPAESGHPAAAPPSSVIKLRYR